VTVQLDASGNGTTSATAVNNGSSDACGIASTSLNTTSFGCGDVGTNTVTLTVTDNNSNTSTCTATVTVADNVAPIAVCQDVTVQLNASGNGTTSASAVNNGSNDVCGIASTSLNTTSFGCGDVGANTVTLTVTDNNSNTSNCTATVTVQDNVAPTAVCQDVTVQLNASGNGTTSATAVNNGSSDACGIASTALNTTSFGCGDVGANTVTLTVTDNNSNTSTCTATVTVEDNVAPTAVCQDLTVQLDASGNGTTSATAVNNSSSDACGIASTALNTTSFGCGDMGANTVTLTITDNNFNTSTCTATVTVEDKVAPVAICQDVTVQLNASGNGTTSASAVNNSSSDACGIASIALNTTSFGCGDVGANTVTLTVTDNNSNTSTCTATVTVADNVAPTAVCQDVTVQLNASGNGMTSATAVNNGSSDACGIASTSLNTTSFGCGDVGANTVTLTVTDNNSNTSTCTAVVTVEDDVAPTAVCQDVTVQLDASGNGTTSATAVNNSSSDACGIASTSLNTTSFGCGDVGANTVTLMVIDNNSNTGTCTAVVTVEDNVAPAAICQDVTVQLDGSGNGTTSASAVNNGSSDACGFASTALSVTSFSCGEVGTQTVTLTVTDVNGNSNSCEAVVTILDEMKPTLTCPGDRLVNTDEGECGASISLQKAAPADNCGVKDLKSRYREVSSIGVPIGDWSGWEDDHSGFFEVGFFEIQWRAIDDSNNEGFCNYSLEVRDEEAPEVICKDITILFNGEDDINIQSASIFNEEESSDACGAVAFISQSLTVINCDAVGEIVDIQVTGMDPNGNTNSCLAAVEVTGMPCGLTEMGIDCEEGASVTFDPAEESFTLTAEDCTGYPDGEVSFVGTTLCGDGEITVRADDISMNARAGVVMMESSDPGSRLVGLVKDRNRKVRTEYRSSINGSMSYKSKTRSGVDWLRITRTGSKFRTYTSTDGSYWRMVYSINFPNFAECIQVGLITYAMDANQQAVAVFSELEVIEENGSYTQSDFPPVAMENHSSSHQLGTDLVLKVSPNPFQQETWINFTLAQPQQLSLSIYNMQGQLVRTLDESLLNAGEHLQTWDGTNQAGVKMPSGIYLVRLQIEDQLINKRVLFQQQLRE
ncbi:MAG: T9SS type A sorting domain-containing protein, partial [Cyanothece sp. SIO1E1]|nr:T9SS type A sorting domain-containing protein [Cyanothece sp. SIO1E1]